MQKSKSEEAEDPIPRALGGPDVDRELQVLPAAPRFPQELSRHVDPPNMRHRRRVAFGFPAAPRMRR